MIIEILLTLVVGPVLELVHPRVKVGRLVDLASRFDENNNKKVFLSFYHNAIHLTDHDYVRAH